MFWNLENFFDYRNDSTSVSDAEFSSRGARRWTKKRFQTKCNLVAKSIMWIATQEGAYQDVIALAEIENANVLRMLIRDTGLSKLGYRYVHFDSPDHRGIDVAMLYRNQQVVAAKPCHIYAADSTVMATRDILMVEMENGLRILVNHHPSKYGGGKEDARALAVKRLAFLVDSLKTAAPGPIVATGDFNDTPDNPIYAEIPLVNHALAPWKEGKGTIRYQGRWELIDHAYSTVPHAEFKIISIPFLLADDKTRGGKKPLRTYTGPRYTGGVSDHLPVLLVLP